MHFYWHTLYMCNIHHNTQHPACKFFQHNEGRNAWDLPMADNSTVLLTHKHIGTRGCKILLFVNRGKRVDGGAE